VTRKVLIAVGVTVLVAPIAIGAVLFPVLLIVEWGWWGLLISVPYVLVLGIGLYAAVLDRPWRGPRSGTFRGLR